MVKDTKIKQKGTWGGLEGERAPRKKRKKKKKQRKIKKERETRTSRLTQNRGRSTSQCPEF